VRFTPQDEEFRAEVRAWPGANLDGAFAGLRGAGGPGREHERYDERLAWNRHLAAAGWTCLGWPAEFGGRGVPLARQVIFHEEYARANAPALVTVVGEELLGPTLIAFGTPEQKARFLPPIRNVTELWCQGGLGQRPAPVSPAPLPAARTPLRSARMIFIPNGPWLTRPRPVTAAR
jgi:alkylation response protein AidB-like acyl-CoA dehydrogenase